MAITSAMGKQTTQPINTVDKQKQALYGAKPVPGVAQPASGYATSGYATPESSASTYDPNLSQYKGGSFLGGSRGGFDGQSSIGGVSAVNPQSSMDVQGFIDQSYNTAMNRLNPQFQQRRDAFEQSMVNRGIPVGSEAYNEGMQQVNWSEDDATQNAILNAMNFGLGAQNQDFMQDATRSGLANSLLQSKWNTDLGWGNIGLNEKTLNEKARQWDQGLGLSYDTLGQRNYEFDSTLDHQYWNDQNQFDYMWDRAGSDDYRWAQGQDRQDYYDQRDAGRYDDALMLSLLGINQPANAYYQDPTSGYASQMSNMTNQQNNNSNFLQTLLFG